MAARRRLSRMAGLSQQRVSVASVPTDAANARSAIGGDVLPTSAVAKRPFGRAAIVSAALADICK